MADADRMLHQVVDAGVGATVVQAGRDVITGDVFVGGTARLRDVWLDPAPVFDEVGVDGFVGREWLVAKVDRFLRSHDRGYVVVQAAAGLGKSALAAWLARDRGWPCHFTRRRNGRATVVALRNLAAQLIGQYGLVEQFAPHGVVPETAGEPGWFDQVLRAAAAVARGEGRRLVIVVDGLDEAEHVDGDLPLGLPVALPLGVFVVVTCRTGTDLAALRQPWEMLSIVAGDERNTADLRRFLTAVTTEEPLASALAHAEVSVGRLVRQLVDRCRGVWVYARYVLDEVRFGLRAPSDLDRLPADLAHYYAESLGVLRQGLRWGEVCLPLLGVLAAAVEPLDVDSLSTLAGIEDNSEVRRLCAGRLRPFLADHKGGDGNRRYGIYHASLREFLTDAALDGAHGVTAHADELAAATTQAHHRIADHYLAEFGGLETGLDRLAARPGIATQDGGYALRHLAHHLACAGRVVELHALLSCERTGGRGVRNVWFDAHDYAGTVDHYLADVSRARRHAEVETDRGLMAGRTVPSVGMEIRYALITAGVTSLVANLPIPLLVALVKTGSWTTARAIAFVRQLQTPGEKAFALAELLPYLSDSSTTDVFAEALAAARRIPDHSSKARALLILSDDLPEREKARVQSEALDTTAAIVDEEDRTQVLGAFSLELPEHLVKQAVAIAMGMEHEQQRAEALACLVPRLPADDLAEVLATTSSMADTFARTLLLGALAERVPVDLDGELLSMVHGTTAPDDRAWLLSKWASRLPATERYALEDAVLDLARSVTTPFNRVWALTAASEQLTATNQHSAILDALVTALEQDADDRSELLSLITHYLPGGDHARLLDETLAAVLEVEDETDRCALLCSMQHRLTQDQASRLSACVHEFRSPSARIRLTAAVSPRCPPAEQREAVQRALDDVIAISEETLRSDALITLAPHLAEEDLEKAVFIASAIERDDLRLDVVGALAPLLPRELLAEALNTTRSIWADDSYAWLIGEIARHLPARLRETLLERASAAARAVLVGRSRAFALMNLAGCVDAERRPVLLKEALEAARAVREPANRVWALAAVAAALPSSQHHEVMLEAARAAADIEDDVVRPWLQSRVAARLPDPLRADVLVLALQSARNLETASYRVVLMVVIAAEMSSPEGLGVLKQALSTARGLGSGGTPLARSLVVLARYAPQRVLAGFLSAVRAVLAADDVWGTPDYDVSALAGHLERVPQALVRHTLAATRALPAHHDMTRMLGLVALHLPQPVQDEVLAEIVNSARWTGEAKRAVLRQARTLWSGGVSSEDWAIVRRMIDGDLRGCQAALAEAIPLVHRAGGTEAVEQCLTAIEAVRRWWAPSPTAGDERNPAPH